MLIVLYARLYFQVCFYKNLFTGQAYVPPPAYYNDPPPGYTDTRDKKNDWTKKFWQIYLDLHFL